MKRMLLTLALGMLPAAVPASAMAHERDRGHDSDRSYRSHEIRRDYGIQYGGYYGAYTYDACPTYSYPIVPYDAGCYVDRYDHNYGYHRGWDRGREWHRGEHRR